MFPQKNGKREKEREREEICRRAETHCFTFELQPGSDRPTSLKIRLFVLLFLSHPPPFSGFFFPDKKGLVIDPWMLVEDF